MNNSELSQCSASRKGGIDCDEIGIFGKTERVTKMNTVTESMEEKALNLEQTSTQESPEGTEGVHKNILFVHFSLQFSLGLWQD